VNLAKIIEDHPADAPALVSRGRATTYGELRDQVASVRGGLVELGLEPGERVATLIGNNWYFVVSYLAALGAGLVVVPLNPQSPAKALEREIANTGPAALIVGPTGRTSFDSIDRSTIPSIRHVIGAGFEPTDGIHLDVLLAADPGPIVDREPTDLAVLIFTSGTAGHPRAAMLTHGNLITNLRQVLATAPPEGPPAVGASDVAFGVLPCFHIYGLNVVLGLALVTGSSVVLIERFDPVSAIESIQKHRVTTIAGPPTMWASFAGIPGVDPDSLATVRQGVSGAAKLPAEVANAVEAKYGVKLEEGYGLTEASPVVCSPTGTDAPIGSVGVPVPGLEVRLVDRENNDVLVGDAGEILVRGPNVFAGYWEDPESTAAVLDEDGWLHTGDVAVVDDDGFLYLVDRVKDLIIVSGFNVFPAEVEEVLLEHPAIDACAVIGVPHPHTGEAVKAYVVPRAGLSIEEDDVIDFCASRLPRYKCPNKVWFVDQVPTALTGKLLRRLLPSEGPTT